MYNSHRGMGPGPQHASRLAELLEQVRQEFDAQAGRSNEHEHQVHNQIQEMEHVRQKIYSLEQQHTAMKAKYEDEIARLRQELEQRGGQLQANAGPSQPPPPAIGHGPSNLFQGIIAGGAAQGGPGLVPPQQEQSGQPGMPGQMHAPPSFQPQGPPQHPFQYGQQPSQPQQALNGYPQAHQNASPRPAAHPTPPPSQRPSHQSNHHQLNGMGYSQEEIDNVGNSLAEYDIDKLPAAYKRTGEDWHVVYNPRLSRKIEVDLLHTLSHESVVCCVRFSHDGHFVATGCNRSAQIFEVSTGKEVCKLIDSTADMVGNDLYIRSVCFSPNGQYLATGAEDKLIRVWNIETQQIIRKYSGHEMDIYSLDFSSDSRHIVSGSGDRSVRVWDSHSEQQVFEMSITDGVTTVAFSPDGRSIAAGSLDRTVRVWDIETGSPRENTEDNEGGHHDSVYSVAFTPDGRYLVSGSLDKTIKMWELSSGQYHGQNSRATTKCIRTFEGHKDYVLSVALTPDGAWVMSGSKDRGVQFWDPQTGQAQLMLQGHKNSVISVAPSPRGGLFATGSGDNKARIWRYDPSRG